MKFLSLLLLLPFCLFAGNMSLGPYNNENFIPQHEQLKKQEQLEKAKQQAFNFTKTMNNAKEIRKQIANIQQNSDDRIFRLIELFKKL